MEKKQEVVAIEQQPPTPTSSTITNAVESSLQDDSQDDSQTEKKVRQKLSSMMGIAALRPMDIPLSGDNESSSAAASSLADRRYPQKIEINLKEASRLRQEADLLLSNAQKIPTSTLNYAHSAVDSYAQFAQSREATRASAKREHEHSSKLLKLRERIAALDRSLNRNAF